jgi:hypothetical protein
MTPKPKVWFVDDLPSNLQTFRIRHDKDFMVSTFNKIEYVLERIRRRDYPDALLCDLFFFDTVDQAQRAEGKLVELAQTLQERALASGVDAQQHALGITLMRQINEEFKGPPPFPMYAYSSEAPYLFGQREWEDVYKFGGRVLLKGRVPPDIEKNIILADIAGSNDSLSLSANRNKKIRILKIALSMLLGIVVAIVLGRLMRGTW